ncbi:histidine kinase [Nitrosopumilus oxyclinae]|uniref:Histidine kinase n=1 Tax=Nitrosopumilus oxyclinae TaxID=1959104 RepID=A0A7D5M2Z0_9ARCH|nr:CBS domain-containing protein [Nitrosopumilus oxyclinae]QLH04731.1 histidine kinase [Nitrosopumilus oxyclinae]
MTQVRDIMEKNVITIDYTKNALDASKILKEKEISFLVILKDGKPEGIVSEGDIVRKVAAEDVKSSQIQIKEIMSKNFKWVNPETEVEQVIQKMLNNNIRCLIVLEDEKLVGVITQTNLSEVLRSKLLITATVDNII